MEWNKEDWGLVADGARAASPALSLPCSSELVDTEISPRSRNPKLPGQNAIR